MDTPLFGGFWGKNMEVAPVLKDLEAKAQDASYVLIHGADLRWLLQEAKNAQEIRLRAKKLEWAFKQFLDPKAE